MKFLKELQEVDDEELENSETSEETKNKEGESDNPEESNDEESTDVDLENMGQLKSFKPITDEDEDGKEENKNRQGLIRTVKGAHLVYKHQNETDRYDELWVYKTKNNGVFQDLDIKNDILSGTDIPINSAKSEDGEQEYDIWHSGDTVFLKIFNLPN